MVGATDDTGNVLGRAAMTPLDAYALISLYLYFVSRQERVQVAQSHAIF